MAKHSELKITLEKYFHENEKLGRKHIYSKFISLGAPKRSLNRWLELLFSKKSLVRKTGSGRPAKLTTKQNVKKITNYFNHRDS